MKKFLHIIFFSPLLFSAQNKTIDSLKLAIKNAKHDTSLCAAYIIWGELIHVAKPDSAIILWKIAQALAEKNIAGSQTHKKVYLKYLANAAENIGYVYDFKGNTALALDYYHNALKIREDVMDKKGIANTFTNLGYLYTNQGNNSQALDYFNKSIKLQEEIGDKRGLFLSLNNIGFVYYNKSNLPKALDCFEKSIKIQEEIGDKSALAQSLNNIGYIFQNKGEIPKALEFFQKTLKIVEEAGDKVGQVNTLANIADLKIKNGQTGEALIYGKKGMQIAKELGFPENIYRVASRLKTIYQKQNRFKEALEMYELEILMRDSIANQATKKASIKSQLKYEYEKRTAADSVKNEEAQKVKDAQLKAQSASLKQEQTQRYALYGGLVLVAGFLIFVINRFRITNKQKKIIEVQKVAVDDAFEKLHEKNKEVMDSIYYASRIQRALITSEKYILRNLDKLNREK